LHPPGDRVQAWMVEHTDYLPIRFEIPQLNMVRWYVRKLDIADTGA